MSIKLASQLPKGTDNGLGPIVRDLARHPDRFKVVLAIVTTTEARLLAVTFKAPPLTVGMVEGPCAPGDRFEPAGYRVGRCKDCGQLAPIRRRLHYGEVYEQLIGHPRPDEEA